MKVLVLSNSDKGLYNFRKELLEKLLEKNYQIYISVPNGERIEDFKNLGCEYIETSLERRSTNIIKDFKLMKFYNKLIKSIKPDVVLTYTIKPNIYGGIACKKNNVPYIANITGLGTALENKGLMQKILIFLYKIAFKKVRCCFIQNEENLKFVKEHINTTDKYKLIPGSGVNLKKYTFLDYPNENENIKFLFMSRIMKEKGIEQYLETAKYIKNKYTNVEFHVLGACEEAYREKLEKMQEENTIIYHGMQKNVQPYINECWCLIHPSYYPEGMSNVLQEASASGRPVITTNRSGCREVVDDEKSGFIVPIKDTEKLIEKVEKFINLEYTQKKEMGLNARKKVEKEFDRNIVIKEYVQEISNI